MASSPRRCLENSDDTRNSPSEVLVKRLRELGAEVVIHDPYVREYQGDLEEKVQGCDAVVVIVAHDAYRVMDLSNLRDALRTPILIGGRGSLRGRQCERLASYVGALVGEKVGRESRLHPWLATSLRCFKRAMSGGINRLMVDH